MLNPEESQDEDDNVVVTDDSEEQPLGGAEVLVSKGQGAGVVLEPSPQAGNKSQHWADSCF